jgi:hypothetical protein
VADTTKWTFTTPSTNPSSRALQVARNHGLAVPIKLKGVCYSPAPLNGSNKDGPALGDWFWDSFDRVGGWDALWARDLSRIRSLGANTIRVYSMLSRQLDYRNGSYPVPWNSGHLFLHQKFLDACWNGGRDPLYVLVGVSLPSDMLWKNLYDKASAALKTYWTDVLRETAETVGRHPAVMGFTVQNEKDGAKVCYEDPELATFWWGQVEKFAASVKQAAPDKIVGIACFDNPAIPGKAASYMATCKHIDFWGVNTYQTANFDPVFGHSENGPGYGFLGAALKPVILTEFGIPATGHRDPNQPATIYDDPTTHSKAAEVVARMVPQVANYVVCVGIYYFEFCDEWWNQPGSPNIYTWWGGVAEAGFPNKFWDQDGFGLYSIKRSPGLPNNAPIWVGEAPDRRIDVHTERTELTSALKKAFGSF